MLKAFKRHFNPWNKVYKHHQVLSEQQRGLAGLSQYLGHPLPPLDIRLSELEFVAFDFETTGVNAQSDFILSIGMVPFTLNEIDVASASEIFINHAQFIKAESAIINHITPKMLKDGVVITQAMDNLFSELAGKVPVVHGSCIERTFLDRFVQEHLGMKSFPCLWLDTIHIEKQFSYKGKTDSRSGFQLRDVRDRYLLPSYSEHSAAVDALATSELFTAQIKSLFKHQTPLLHQLLSS